MSTTLDFEQVRIRNLLQGLNEDALDFAEDPRFTATLRRAVRQYYGADVRADAMLASLMSDEEERARFYPWALWDLQHDPRGPIGAHYLAETRELDDTSKRLLRAYLRSTCRFYELGELSDHGFTVREHRSGRHYEVIDDAMLPSFRSGTIIFGRLLSSSSWKLSRFDAIYHVLAEPLFARFLERSQPLPERPTAWSKAYPTLMEQLDDLQSGGAEISNEDGERVLISTLLFELSDEEDAQAALRDNQLVVSSGNGESGALLHDDSGRCIAALEFVAGSARLRCTCESVGRAEQALDAITGILPETTARFLTTVYSNVDFAVMEALECLSFPVSLTLLESLREAFAIALGGFLDDWWDLPLTRFRGQSPRDILSAPNRDQENLRSFLAQLEPLLNSGPLRPRPIPPGDRRF